MQDDDVLLVFDGSFIIWEKRKIEVKKSSLTLEICGTIGIPLIYHFNITLKSPIMLTINGCFELNNLI